MWSLVLAVSLAHAAPEMIPLEDTALVGRAAPVVRGALLDGGTFDLEQVRGRPVVISFWASWCGPCRLELPELSKLAAARKDVAFYAVNVDRDPNLARRFLSQVEVSLPIVLDPDSKALGQYAVMSMPTTFVLDRHHTVKLQKVGFSQEKGLAEIEAALGGAR